MTRKVTRRDALKLFAAGLAATGVACSSTEAKHSKKGTLQTAVDHNWANTHDRIWLGGEYWANPMEDWQVRNGSAECVTSGGQRSVHSLQHQLVDTNQVFKTTARVKLVEKGAIDGGVSIRLGIRSELNEFRSNCFVQQGLDVGILNNEIVVGNKRKALQKPISQDEVNISISGKPQAQAMALTVIVQVAATNEVIGQYETLVGSEQLLGNIALVSNFNIPSYESGPNQSTSNGGRYQFTHWHIEGPAFSHNVEQKFGPILWTMYTLSDSRSDQGFIAKLSVLTGPLGKQDNKQVELHIKQDGQWQAIKKAELDPSSWVATFKVPNWNEKVATPFRAIYYESQVDGSTKPDIYEGIIAANPTGRKMKMAALTCQNDYGFPYEPVANNVVKLKPDLVYFSGDQIYESHGGFGIIRAPADAAIINYLRKYYQFGWAFREAMRNAPTVVLPDDHDVLQGNLWGDGGMAMAKPPLNNFNADKWGGYIEPVKMLNAVHRTHTAHHPDPIDPKPTPSGISMYYTEMVYGNVSFAILADRMWKSGPEHLNIIVGSTGEDEAPDYFNPKFDRDDLHLLGDRQEQFLTQWGKDWRGHELKVVLSQTVFAGISTHQPDLTNYIKYDFDGSGWPASARNRAIDIMRESKALHICGDTHLGSLSQYGVASQRDSNWAFCTPAISAGWPRWWLPDNIGLSHTNRPAHGIEQTGEYKDSFGNNIYVYAVANPEVGQSSNRYVKAHEKGSGFGVIHFDTEAKTYHTEAYRFLIDIEDGAADNMFDGWPVTIHQDENAGKNRIG